MDFQYPWTFESRRSATISPNGMVATSQPLAARAGLRMLEKGGNAADAAIATAAVLNVVEPHMTGIGGDMFALTHFDGEYEALNGSGRAPSDGDINTYRTRVDETDEAGEPVMPTDGGLAVTVPGALDGWEKLLERYGTFDLSTVFEPAIEYAESGFGVTEYVSRQWEDEVDRLRRFDGAAETFLIDGDAPDPGQRFANPEFAETLRTIAAEGTDVFYSGHLGEQIVETVQKNNGLLSLADLENHDGEWVDPIETSYQGVSVLEHPPNTQGTIALEALNIAENFDLSADPKDPERIHRLIEATKIGFADGHEYITDPNRANIPIETMLSSSYAAERAGEINDEAGMYGAAADDHSDTVYLSVVDSDGNAVSFINSIYLSFGSGLTVGGFALQNRGCSFSLDPDHYNRFEAGKRPFHTIIPAMIREDGEFRASFGVMGGSMQPQGHVQVVANLVDSNFNPQAALDAPRFRFLEDRQIALETSRLLPETIEALKDRGHEIIDEDEFFFEQNDHWGGGQIIYRKEDGLLIGGTDPRKDGQVIGY